MSNESDDNFYPTSENEPKVHPLIRKSFAFVPSTGMRLAPEVLLLELFREVFYQTHFGSKSGKDLNPDELEESGSFYYSLKERAVLHALRGRRRKGKKSKSKPFFAPSYPTLARNGWLGKNRERVIYSLLFEGAMAQYLWHSGETEEKKREQKNIVKLFTNALVGNNSYNTGDPSGKDILSVALKSETSLYEVISSENLLQKTRSDYVLEIENDILSQRICKDLLALCSLENDLPRMQWLNVLMTFLRFSLPMWLLAHMRITGLLHGWLLDAFENGHVVGQQDIESEIAKRNEGLLHPALTPTREIFESTEKYVKNRVELNILLYNLENLRESHFKNKRLRIGGKGSGVITVEQVLRLAADATNDLKSSNRFRHVLEGGSVQDFLTREAEQFQAWRDPLNKGQGKNIDEFFRVLYRDNLGDEAGGYLLVSEGRGRTRGFRVFPGQLLLKTITFLAAYEKQTNGLVRGGGRLVLEDVENLFKQYGIDFSCAADARPLLMRELQAMGLLTGSPDAGSSVAVTSPY